MRFGLYERKRRNSHIGPQAKGPRSPYFWSALSINLIYESAISSDSGFYTVPDPDSGFWISNLQHSSSSSSLPFTIRDLFRIEPRRVKTDRWHWLSLYWESKIKRLVVRASMLKRPTLPVVKPWLGSSVPLLVPRAWKKCFKDLTETLPYVSFFLLNLISVRSIWVKVEDFSISSVWF